MKKNFIFLTLFIIVNSVSFSQDRCITRGSVPGELYVASFWYCIYVEPFSEILRAGIFRLTENGKKLTVQYEADTHSIDLQHEMFPSDINADVTSGVIYNGQPAIYPSFWVSCDYGKNWILREMNPMTEPASTYYAVNLEGTIYKCKNYGYGCYKSTDYGQNFILTESIELGGEPGLNDCEFFLISGRGFWYTYDCQNYMNTTIGEEYATGDYKNDVYRGGLPGEVYVTSVFPAPGNGNETYHVSFSADTGHTFRTVYISEIYDVTQYLYCHILFMSDREPGVFYIIRLYDMYDENPFGWHKKLCVQYYRDYGETLVDIYCHDLTKDYENETCAVGNNLTSKKIDDNSVLLTWTNPENDLLPDGYRIFKNGLPLTYALTTATSYLDENLPIGNYEYYVRTYYEEGCVSDSSNHVRETIILDITDFMDFEDIILYPNPTGGEFKVQNSKFKIQDVEVFDIYGRKLLEQKAEGRKQNAVDISNLKAGLYFVRIATERGVVMRKVVKM